MPGRGRAPGARSGRLAAVPRSVRPGGRFSRLDTTKRCRSL